MIQQFAFTVAIAVATALPAVAHDYRLGSLVIDHPWARATPAGAGFGAGYTVIRNEGETPDRLVGASATCAGRVDIHEMAMQDGVMRMRALANGLEIPSGGSVTLAPGGYHVMVMQLQTPLVEGEDRPATLAFAVEGMAAGGMGHGHYDASTN